MENGRKGGGDLRLDVVVLTRNSQRMLERCFNSIYKGVPTNRLIVVDGYSTDKTLDIVDQFNRRYGNVVVIQDGGTRGSARQKGIEVVETEWFMFVDSDVTLCDGWFEKAKRLIREDVGAIWGLDYWSILRNSFTNKVILSMVAKGFEYRGGMHDLLVRYEAIRDIKIPHHLHRYEDAYVKDWIINKGYKVVVSYDPYCIHYRTPAWSFSKGVRIGLEEIRSALRNGYVKALLHQAAPYFAFWFSKMMKSKARKRAYNVIAKS